MVAVGGPLVAQTEEERQKQLQTACLSNLKQIGTAVMMYVQDYDEMYPLAQSGMISNGTVGRARLGWAPAPSPNGKTVPGIVSPYLRDQGVFRCPAVTTNRSPTTYMMNDLAAGASLPTVTAPAFSVFACDGEDVMPNVGHAYQPNNPPAPATKFDKKGRVPPGYGARMRTAPTRHAGGANYAFLDGHCKWLKPEAVYFPPRASGSLESDPKAGEPMSTRPTAYQATFRLIEP